MTDYVALKAEITTDPLARGYAGMTNVQIAASLNTANRTRNRTIMTASEIINAINVTEFNALTATNKAAVWDLLHLGELNPFGVEATMFTSIFGGGSTTIATLASLRAQSISRAVELGLGVVSEGLVAEAKAQT